MDAKESLKIVLSALSELKKQHLTRQILIDFIRGNESREIMERGLNELESFGLGDKHEEPYYNTIIDQAVNEKYLKVNTDGCSITAKGERYLKSPVPFILKGDNEEEEPNDSDNEMLDILVETALNDKEEDIAQVPTHTPNSPVRSQQMIRLIQAIDLKMPLDDYAEQYQIDFDEVLDNLEHLIKRGVNIDISYFTNDVLGKECLDELHEYFDEVDGDLQKAFEEFYGIYQPEEIRLARLIWKK